MKNLFSVIFLGSLFLFSCATSSFDTYQSPHSVNVSIRFQPVKSKSGPEVKEILKLAYGKNFEPENLKKKLDAALKKYPHNAALHEVGAMYSMLEEDNRSVFRHLIKAAVDLNSKHTPLYLELISNLDLTYSERNIFKKALELLVTSDVDPETKQASRIYLYQIFKDENDPERAEFETGSNGFIRNWMLIGSFDNENGKGYYEEFGPEKETVFFKEYKGKVVDLKWRKLRLEGPSGILHMKNLVYPATDSLSYLYTLINVPSDKDYTLNISTSDSIKVFINGKEVASEENVNAFSFDNVKVKVGLRQGVNSILLKTCQRKGSWLVGARITDDNNKVASDIVQLSTFKSKPIKSEVKSELIFPVKEHERTADSRALILEGINLVNKGYDKYSRAYLEKVFTENPMNLFAIYLMAETLSVAGEEGKYIDLLNGAIIKSSSKLSKFFMMRGDFYSNKGQKESAEADYRKAYQLNADSLEYYKNMSWLFRSKGWLEDARQVLDKGLTLYPDSISLIRNMGSLLNSMGYNEDGEVFYRKALELRPGDSDLISRLYYTSKKKRDYRASAFFINRSILMYPYNISNYFKLYDVFRSQKDFNNAKAQLEKIEKFNSNYPQVYRKKGDLFYENGHKEKALENWEIAYKLNPADSYISERLTYLKEEEKDPAEDLMPDDKKIMEFIKKAAEFKTSDGAHTLFVLDHAVCRINSDGSSKWYITEVSKALNDEGRDAMMTFYMPYSGRKKMLSAYSVDGNFKRSEASSVSGYEIRFRQLKKGDYTVIQYVHYQPAQRFLENHFSSQWFFQSPLHHVMYSEWNVLHDKKEKLNIDIYGGEVKQTKSEVNGDSLYTFIAEDVEPLNYEPYSPPVSDYTGTITVSTVDDWTQYVNWEKALLKDVFSSDVQVKKKAQELLKDKKTVQEKIDTIFEFVAQEIRYQQEYESTIAGVRPHTSAQILERGYGDCKDKAVLFIHLAKEMNIKVNYTVLRTRSDGKLHKKIPGQQFNHAIVYIPKQEGVEKGYFLDPTVDLLELGSLREDDQGTTALVLNVDSGEYKFMDIPFQKPEMNFQKYDRTYTLSSDLKLKVNDKIQLRGGTSSMFRRIMRTREIGDKAFQRLANNLFKGGVLIDYEHSDIEDISKPFSLMFNADVSNLVTVQKEETRIKMPEQVVSASFVSMEKRKLPLWTGIPSVYDINIAFKIPEDMKFSSTPEDFKVEYKCFTISRKTILEEKGTDLKISYAFNKSCTEISVDDYSEFRKAILSVIQKQNDFITIVKK